MLQVNYRSVFSKILDFFTLVDTYNPDVVTGTESWLGEEISKAEVFSDGYIILMCLLPCIFSISTNKILTIAHKLFFITKFHLHVSANVGHPQGVLLQNISSVVYGYSFIRVE